jgi:propanol-preferring alcohol dehydrogenase
MGSCASHSPRSTNPSPNMASATEVKATPAALPAGLPATYRAVQITTPGHLQMNTLPMKLPEEYEVLVKVISCGLCHGDSFMVEKRLPNMTLPRVPGHEVIGYVVAIGSKVKRFKVGDKVGRGWHGGHCFQCDNCSDGNFVACNDHQSTGGTSDGGYAEYMLAPFESLARIPEGVSMNTGGPFVCAGLTCYNALRNSHFETGHVVAIQVCHDVNHCHSLLFCLSS